MKRIITLAVGIGLCLMLLVSIAPDTLASEPVRQIDFEAYRDLFTEEELNVRSEANLGSLVNKFSSATAQYLLYDALGESEEADVWYIRKLVYQAKLDELYGAGQQ